MTLDGADHAVYTLDADDNPTQMVFPNETQLQQTWDSLGRLTAATHRTSGATPFAQYSYTYNNNGLRTGVTELDGRTVAWGYDTLNRLLTAGSASCTWNDTGTLAGKTAGGATTNYTWDYDAQFTGLSTGQSFAYDAQGRRVGRTAGGVTTTSCFDGSTVVLEKQGSTTTASYTHGLTLLTRGSETMHTDGHGSLRAVTSPTEAVTATGNWETYGQAAGGTGASATPYQYGATSGYRNDGDGGLLHIGVRWYDPAMGRWISADSYLGSQGQPQLLQALAQRRLIRFFAG